jgi:hypothetical protein
MANKLILNYISDTSIPAETRRSIAQGVNSGELSELAAMQGITGKYGEKYGKLADNTPAANLRSTIIQKAGSFLANPAQAIEDKALDMAKSSAPAIMKGAIEYGQTISPEEAAADIETNKQTAATRESNYARQTAAAQKSQAAGITMPASFSTLQEPGSEAQTAEREQFATQMEAAADAQNPALSFAKKTAGAAGQALTTGAEGLGEMATAGSDTVKMAQGFGKVANAPLGVVGAPVSAAISMAPQPIQDLANTVMQTPANLAAGVAKNILTGETGINGMKLDLVPGGAEVRKIIQKLRQTAGQNPEIDVNSDEYKQGVEEPIKNAANFLMARQSVKNVKAIKEAPKAAVEYFGEKTGLKDLITKSVEQLRSEKITKGLEEQNTRLKSVNKAFNENTKTYKTPEGISLKVTPIDTLSKHNILPVIEKGTINMGDYKTGTGALGQIKSKVSNLDAEIDSQLVNAGKKIQIQDLWQKSVDKANANPYFKAAGTVESNVNKINKRFGDYANSYGDTVDIAELNNIRKVANRDWSPETIDTSRIIGDIARDEVYNATPDVSIKNMLKEQGELLAAKNYSIKLNGTKVTGGRLGNYAARTTGAVIGSTLTSLPVAGPILGMLGGEYLARALQQSQFKSIGAEAKALLTPKK